MRRENPGAFPAAKPPRRRGPENVRRYAAAMRGGVSAGAIAAVILLLASLLDDALNALALSGWKVSTLIGAIAVATVANGWQRRQQMLATFADEAPLRLALVRAILARGPSSEKKGRSGDKVSLATDGVERVARYTGGFMSDIISAVVGPVTLLVLMAIFIDPLSALVLALGIAAGLRIIKWFATSHREEGSKSRQARGRVATAYLDAIQGLETLALLRATRRVGEQLAHMGEQQRQATMRLLARNQQLLLVIDLAITAFLLIAAVTLSGWSLAAGRLSLGQAGAVLAFTIIMIEPLEMVGAFFYIAMAGRAIERRIKGVIAGSAAAARDGGAGAARTGGAGPARTGGAGAARDASAGPARTGGAGAARTGGAGAARTGGAAAPHATGPAIALVNISHRYPGAQADSLPATSLTIEAGEHVAIKGDSGSGKSTLLSLLAGDLALQNGTITIGAHHYQHGQDDPAQRRQQCAVVAQHSWLFTGTVRENLAIGAPSASDDAMWEALERAYIADEIRALPNGLDTEVGERGGMFSGGQVQRLALARAFLSGRPILILDEPTSQIDKHSEAHICRALADAGTAITVLMATHRDSSTAGFDRVITVGGQRETH